MKYIAYTDGACRGNPGQSGAGVHIIAEGEHGSNVFRIIKHYIGITTNNIAEYVAAILALEELWRYVDESDEIVLLTDSKLMANQLNNIWSVKSDDIKPLYSCIMELSSKFKKFTVAWISRVSNVEADRLANEAIDEYNRNHNCDTSSNRKLAECKKE